MINLLRDKNLIAMATVLLETETDSKHFPRIDASAIKPLKMSPKRTEWDTSQSAPKSFVLVAT
jgi:hypothetical protein